MPSGIETSRILWEPEPVTITADEAMAPTDAPEERSELDDAKRFLLALLEDGPVPSRQIQADAQGAGHAWRTIRRAQAALHVEARKTGIKGPWVWELPPKVSTNPEGVQEKYMDTFGPDGHLRNPYRCAREGDDGTH